MVQGSLMISHLDSQDFQCLGSMDRSSREIQDKWLNKISTAVHDTRSARLFCSSTDFGSKGCTAWPTKLPA